MTDPQTKILNEIVRLWNQPPALRPIGTKHIEYYPDWGVEPEDVLRSLRAAFSESEIEGAVSSALDTVIATEGRRAVPDPRTMFLADRCLALTASENGVSLSKERAMAVVRSLAPVGWYKPVGNLIRKQLNAAEVLEALLSGLRNAGDSLRMSCLEGLRLYRGIANKPADTNRLRELADEVQRVVESMTSDESPAVREFALAAGKSMVSDWLR
jgi:hypothetical protein